MKLEKEDDRGRLLIVAAAGDTIEVDGKVVGVGRWEGAIAKGGHVVRITSEEKLPYEGEVFVRAKQTRELRMSLQAKQQEGGAMWWWIAGGAAVLTGAAIGGYFLLKPEDEQPAPPVVGTMSPGTALLMKSKTEGICGLDACLIPLDGYSEEGWQEVESRLVFPRGVCEQMEDGGVAAVVVTTACETKTSSVPTCGPWSSVTEHEGRFDAGGPDVGDLYDAGVSDADGEASDASVEPDAEAGAAGSGGSAGAGGAAGTAGSAGAGGTAGTGGSLLRQRSAS